MFVNVGARVPVFRGKYTPTVDDFGVLIQSVSSVSVVVVGRLFLPELVIVGHSVGRTGFGGHLCNVRRAEVVNE